MLPHIGDLVRPRLTVDGLRNLLADLRTAGRPLPQSIIVSESDRRDLNQDLLGGAANEVAREDQRPEHDGQAVGIVEGVVILSHPDLRRGQARLVYPQKPNG